jgi:predicted ATPase
MPAGITRITIEGYKSIVKEQSIEIAPLTILAGANSSGKSSMIQPLLLLNADTEGGHAIYWLRRGAKPVKKWQLGYKRP